MPGSTVTVVDVEPDAVIARVTCARLDEEQLQQLRSEVLAAAVQHPAHPLVLDLAAVSFVPSMSLAALIRLSTDFRAREQRLILCGLQPAVRELFTVTRLDRLFDLQPDSAAAVRALRPG